MLPELDRRALLRIAGVSLLAAGCRGADTTPPVALPSSSASRRSPSPSPSPPPPPRPYVPLANEPVPNCKKAAADFVQALTTGEGRAGPEAGIARAMSLTGSGFDADQAAAVARPIFADVLSRGEIVYPQLGGLVPISPGARSASVMVIVRQQLISASGRSRDEVRVCDVRLGVQDGQWRVVELASVGGEPVNRPDVLDPRAARALDDARIELPDSARWDVHAGRISLNLLDILAAAAGQAPVSVTVLRSGHPRNVFGSTRVSDHTEGRAVDVWRIAGQPLVNTGASTGPAERVLRTAFASQVLAQAGSPVGSDLDGPSRRRSFVNLVHQDHLHLAARGRGAAPTG